MDAPRDPQRSATPAAPPRGDEGRSAVDALRGYGFQIYGSVLAWTCLAEEEVLHLELVEDYATALHATQAKDTRGSGSVTLNTTGVIQAIDSLVDLTDRNPERAVHLRYMTTSPIGLEASQGDRVEGEPGLAYWGRVAAGGADPGPLLRRLRAMPLKARTKALLAKPRRRHPRPLPGLSPALGLRSRRRRCDPPPLRLSRSCVGSSVLASSPAPTATPWRRFGRPSTPRSDRGGAERRRPHPWPPTRTTACVATPATCDQGGRWSPPADRDGPSTAGDRDSGDAWLGQIHV